MIKYQRYFIFNLLFIFKFVLSAYSLYRMKNNDLSLRELPQGGNGAYVILPTYLYHRNAKIKFKIKADNWYNPSYATASYKLFNKDNITESDAIDPNDRKTLTYTVKSLETLFDEIYITSSTNFVVIIYSPPSGSSSKISGHFSYSIEYTFPIQRMDTSTSGSLSFSGEKEKSYFYEMKLEVGQIQLNIISKLLLEKFFLSYNLLFIF